MADLFFSVACLSTAAWLKQLHEENRKEELKQKVGKFCEELTKIFPCMLFMAVG